VWRWPLQGDGAPERLDDGSADFVFDPYITTCGTTLVWQAWNVPDMAWDASRVQRITFDEIAISGGLGRTWPRRTVEASNKLYTFADLLRRLRGREGGAS